MKLYKYLPSKYLDSVIKKGNILFRNLSYFRKYDDFFRGDVFEGMHRDSPDEGFSITNLRTGITIKNKFTFINEVDYNEIFIFCLSKVFDKTLFEVFKCDTCIEITDANKFIQRIYYKVTSLNSTSKEYGFHNGDVRYYNKNENDLKDIDIHDPKIIPFLKDKMFINQNEYRLVYGRGKSSSKVVKKIVMPKYTYREDEYKYEEISFNMPIGNIENICRVLNK